MSYSVVVPTIGRATLSTLLRSVAEGPGGLPREVVVVNDRPTRPLRVPVPSILRDRVHVLAGAGRGPAAARNRGWCATTSDWVVFLDDDVVPDPGWRATLAFDLAVGAAVGAVAGHIRVPVAGRATDWQRQVMALADAPWITADIAYRRDALTAVDGFHEGFTGAYREDIDLAVRVRSAGFDLIRGGRSATHPVGAAGRWTSVIRQRGNADDALLRRRYGRKWRRITGVPRGRRRGHVLTTVAAVVAFGALVGRRRGLAVLAIGGWLGLTADFADRRILSGPRTADEVATMVVTSVAIPPVATAHWVRGWWRHRRVSRVRLSSSRMGRAAW
jgi:glycosyltransferase involved in cell wall biosynthesis